MNGTKHFDLAARVLHWSMARAILTMLFVGVGMVTSLSLCPAPVSLHRALGIAILQLVIARLWSIACAIGRRRCRLSCPPCRY